MLRTISSLALALAFAGCGGLEAPAPSSSGPPPKAPDSTPPSPAAPSGASDAGPPTGASLPTDAPCPTSVDWPADCGEYAAACAGASPLVIGTFSRISDLAVGGSLIYFSTETTDLSACGGSIYRTSIQGGDSYMPWSVAVATSTSVASLAAGAENVFWLASGQQGSTLHISAPFDTVGPADTVLATVPQGIPTYLAPGAGYDDGVLFGQGSSLSAIDGKTVRAFPATVGPLGSTPAYDGSSVVASLPDGTLAKWDGSTGAMTTLASNATSRSERTVAIADGVVFFVTGDPEVDFGTQPRPMGIFRVPLTGGDPVPLVAPAQQNIAMIALDATRVYFVEDNAIRAVPRAGGPVLTVATLGAPPRALQVAADGLLVFILDVHPSGYGELSGPGGIVATVRTPD